MKIDILGSIFLMFQQIFDGILTVIVVCWQILADNGEKLLAFLAVAFVYGILTVTGSAFLRWMRR